MSGPAKPLVGSTPRRALRVEVGANGDGTAREGVLPALLSRNTLAPTYAKPERQSFEDAVVVEAPLEVCVAGEPIASTLRTPGHDRELALGMLVSLTGIHQSQQVRAVTESDAGSEDARRVNITLADTLKLDSSLFHRFATQQLQTSACGACGDSQLLTQVGALSSGSGSPATADLTPCFSPEFIAALLARFEAHQALFAQTGGLHAAAIASADGIECVFEDVGRHNAVDKAIGHLLEREALPAHDKLLLVTSRGGYEIVQKASMAGIRWVVCLSAATSLAIDLALQQQITLVAFARGTRFNVYSCPERLS